MTIGITGASGVIGKILCEKLTAKNYKISLFEGDIRSKSDVSKWMKNDFSAVFHLAAIVPVNQVSHDPLLAYSVNVGGTINLLENIISLAKKTWFFYAGTAHVYKSSDLPINEESPIEPITLYGETKWMAEKICMESSKAYELDLCCGRIFSFYHKSQQKPFLYPTIIERLSTEDLSKPFKLFGANSVRDFLNAEDVVGIMIQLMEKKASGIVNIASGKGVKIRDFVQGLTDRKLDIQPAGDKTDYLLADVVKLNKILGKSI